MDNNSQNGNDDGAGNESCPPQIETVAPSLTAGSTSVIGLTRRQVLQGALGVGLLMMLPASSSRAQSGSNTIINENAKPGTSAWQITNLVGGSPGLDPEIAGFATAVSVNTGGSLAIKIRIAAGAGYCNINTYRLGYYNGIGARQVDEHTNVFVPASNSSDSGADSTTRLLECTNWPVVYTASTNNDWTSGLYITKLTDNATGKQSYVWFIVRNDSDPATFVFSSSFNTLQAYNSYGGYSLYNFNSNSGGDRAYKVSYERPFAQASYDSAEENNILRWEFAMAYWLESLGYYVTYITDADLEDSNIRSAALNAYNHCSLLSVGHDEYWSDAKRNALEQARDSNPPLNLGFFTADACYWRIRFETSPGSKVGNRVIACYKDDWLQDPNTAGNTGAATNEWRGIQVNRPENSLIGVMYTGDQSAQGPGGGSQFMIANGASSDPYLANTGLSGGSSISNLVGYEWDAVVNNGSTPSGLVTLGASSLPSPVSDYGQYLGNPPLFTDRLPVNNASNDGVSYELGLKFQSNVSGVITSIRYFRALNDNTTHIGRIWDPNGNQLGSTTFASESPYGWQRYPLSTPVRISANTTYIVSVNTSGPYVVTQNDLSNNISVGHLTALAGGGVYGPSGSFPTNLYANSNYMRDLDFAPDGAVDLAHSNAVRYTAPSGGKVFATGSIKWAWGLATPPAGAFTDPNPRVSQSAIQITKNVLADLATRKTASSGTTYSFADAPAGYDQPLNGTHSGINFGTGNWFSDSGAWAGLSQYGYFSAAVTSRTFTLPAGDVLQSIQVSGVSGGTYTISDGVNTAKTGNIANNSPTTVNTGWASGGQTITVTFSQTDNSGVDNITYAPGTGTVATPTFSLAGGTYTGAQSVTLSDATSGAMLYYTTNGSTPTTGSTKYTGAIAVSATETVKAIAVASGMANSAVASAAYTISAPSNTVYSFADAGSNGEAINGTHAGINFGTGVWFADMSWTAGGFSGPVGWFGSNSNSGSASFTLPAGKYLKSLVVGGDLAGTYTIADGVNTAKTGSIAAGKSATVSTGWTSGGTTITVTFSKGWDGGVTAITY